MFVKLGYPDLTRTKAAIDAYDRGEVDGEAVGVAFGHDTADRNNMENCRALVRPGKKDPGHPDNLSWLRRSVLEWEQRALSAGEGL